MIVNNELVNLVPVGIFFTTAYSFSTLFVLSFGLIDPEKAHWGSGQLRYIIYFLSVAMQVMICRYYSKYH